MSPNGRPYETRMPSSAPLAAAREATGASATAIALPNAAAHKTRIPPPANPEANHYPRKKLSRGRTSGVVRISRVRSRRGRGFMTIRRIELFAMTAIILVSTVAGAQPGPVNDGQGKEWRQLTDTAGLTRDQVAEVCPRDGLSPCSGVAAEHDLTGWIWATDSEVIELFGIYVPDILTSSAVQGPQAFFAAQTFFGSFRPTFSFFITYQSGQFAAGWTAS